MSAQSRRLRSSKQHVNCDLELRPLMNVFIVLIPMLLMSAVFIEIRVIEMSMPRAADGSTVQQAQAPLELAIRIRKDAYLVEGAGIVLQTIPRPAVSNPKDPLGTAASAALTRVLLGIAATHPENKDIRIIATSDTHYHEIVALMDLARAAGLPQAALEGSVSKGV